MPFVVGALGSPVRATVDRFGSVTPGDVVLEWWVGAEDRWRFPSVEHGVRQGVVGGAPAVETALRVPGGDARHRVYGGPAGLVVVEVENDSPAPFVLALVLRARPGGSLRTIEPGADGGRAVHAGGVTLLLPGPARRWASATDDGALRAVVASGRARPGPPDRVHDARGRAEVALLLPVAHRTTTRLALAAGRDVVGRVEHARLPGVDEVARGWRSVLDRGLRVEVDDRAVQEGIDLARASLLLEAEVARRPTPDLVAALEDWGFDAEAAAAWERASTRVRRRAARRGPRAGATWSRVQAAVAREGVPVWDGGPETFLASVHDVLLADHEPVVDLLPGFPVAWLGRGVAVHDAPLRAGTVSFALRWHGERPALLWDAPPGTTLRAPALAPGWSTSAPVGEALLPAPPSELLPMGSASPPGAPSTEPPDSFT